MYILGINCHDVKPCGFCEELLLRTQKLIKDSLSQPRISRSALQPNSMTLIRIITQAGPGATIVTVLVYSVGKYWFPDIARNELVLAAAVFGFLFGLILKLLSKQAISFISFPIIVRAKRKIEEKNNQGHFYFDNEDKKNDFDKFDGQVFQYTCLFYSGLLVAVVSGIHAFLLAGPVATFGLLSVAGLSIVVLCGLSIIKIRNIIMMSSVMFE